MSGRDDLERDIAEEDEVSALLRSSDGRSTVPPFSDVTRRAEQHRNLSPGFAFVAAALLVVVVVAGVGGWRAASTGTAPTGPVPTATLDASASGAACFAPAPANAFVGQRSSGRWLLTSLDAVQPTDPQKNQLRWVVRFSVPQGAPGPASVSASARITAGDRSLLHVLGYETLEPEQRAVSETELLSVKPCVSLLLVIRTAGPLIEGTFPYTVTVEKVGLPEGGTVSETFTLLLNCSNRSFTCDPAGTAMTPAPTATPVAGVLKPEFGIIYDGVRQGWEKGSAPLVRREGESHIAVGELAPSFFNQFNGAVSPDGRRAVYFAQRQGEPWTLYLLDGARPNEQRAVATIPKEIFGGRLVWSADGNGVAFEVLDEGANQGVRPTYSAVRTIDLSTGAVNEIARVEGGDHYELIGWDRERSAIALRLAPHAAPATTYVVLSPGGKRTWALDGEYQMVTAPNGRDVAGVRCERSTGCALSTWSLEDFGNRMDRKLGSGLSIAIIGWRPGSSELGLFIGDVGAPWDRIDLWAASGGRRTVLRHSLAGSGYPSLSFFRADGSALIMSRTPADAVVVDLASGTTSPLPLPTPQQPFESSRLRASIRLGS